MKPPPQNLAEAVARLKESNDALKKHLDKLDDRKSVPPSPWQTSIDKLTAPAKVRR